MPHTDLQTADYATPVAMQVRYNIAADVGGTNTRFALLQTGSPNMLFEKKYHSADFDKFDVALHSFIEDCPPDCGDIKNNLGGLSLAFAGIVTESTARLTNLPWVVEKRALQERFHVDAVYFMNDFTASAMGLAALPAQDKVVLNKGVHRDDGTRVITGAGTGLGMAWGQGGKAGFSACSSEGGHVDFAPVNDIQIELLRYMLARHEHVSYERLLSGDGLVTLYEFSSGRTAEDILADKVSQYAASGNDHAIQAMALFTQIYGAYVGNLALMFKPDAGIYITGGIGLKNRRWMESDCFMEAFRGKGRMSELANTIPIYLVTNEQVGLLGAAQQFYR